jgi:hypothetical protein
VPDKIILGEDLKHSDSTGPVHSGPATIFRVRRSSDVTQILPSMRLALELVTLIGIITVALAVRIPKLRMGLGQDELFTAVNFINVHPFWRTVTSNAAFNNHIGYSVLARISQYLFGHTEVALRLPALLFGMVTIVIGYACIRKILDRLSATVFALLLAVSPPHVGWSVSARGYSGMICLTMASTLLFFLLKDKPSKQFAIAYVVASVLAIYVHLYSAFVVVVQFAIHVWDRFVRPASHGLKVVSGNTMRLCFLAIAGLSCALYAPTLSQLLHDLAGRGHGTFDASFPLQVLMDLSGSGRPEITVLIVSIAAMGSVVLMKTERTLAIYCGLLFVVPLMLMWLVNPFDLYSRFFAYWLPYFLCGFVAGLRAIWNSTLQWKARFAGPAAAFAVLLLIISEWVATLPSWIVDEGYRDASFAAMHQADPSTGFCAIGGARTVWHYYIKSPIATPGNLKEFEALANRYREVRCVYYNASWQSQEQKQIASFLGAHGTYSKINDQISWFAFRKDLVHE